MLPEREITGLFHAFFMLTSLNVKWSSLTNKQSNLAIEYDSLNWIWPLTEKIKNAFFSTHRAFKMTRFVNQLHGLLFFCFFFENNILFKVIFRFKINWSFKKRHYFFKDMKYVCNNAYIFKCKSTISSFREKLIWL